MALYKFAKAIFEGNPIDVYNHGKMRRDFTYVEDVVEALQRILDKIPEPNLGWDSDCPDPGSSNAPYRLFNIGNHQPTELGKFIEVLEQAIGIAAIKNYLPMQPGDLLETYADVEDLRAAISFSPTTPIEVGVAHFVNWYREYNHLAPCN
jgi:UDP-glucuronate 4-epimerase